MMINHSPEQLTLLAAGRAISKAHTQRCALSHPSLAAMQMVTISGTSTRPEQQKKVPDHAVKMVVLEGEGYAGLMLRPVDILGGLEVHRVTSDGLCGLAGLCDGDVLLSINGQPTVERNVAIKLLSEHSQTTDARSAVRYLPAKAAADLLLKHSKIPAEHSTDILGEER
eukprot:3792083-Prymnesium_polylepis.1